MNWDDVSDFNITKTLITKFFIVDFEDLLTTPAKDGQTFVDWGDGANWHKIDLCNSWVDMGPLIDANRINLNFSVISRRASARNGDKSHQNNNILRAAAIVYLMMNGVKPEDCK